MTGALCDAAGMNMSGRARRSRALVGSGIVAAAVVLGGSGPAPGQVPDPLVPEVEYLDAFGPAVYGYEDCDGVVSTEEDPDGFVFVELDDEAPVDLAIGITFTGDLADDLVDPPTEIEVEAGEFFGEASFGLDELEVGELTVTVEPGVGYTIDDDAEAYTFSVTDEVEIVASCLDDLGTPPGGTDRQTIEVGGRPEPIGFFDEEDLGSDDDFEEDGESTSTESEATTEPATTATTDPGAPVPLSAPFAGRAVPSGYSTPVADGTLPPGLAYAEDEWTGAATTAGTYDFDVRLCFDQSSFAFAGRPTTAAERAMGRRQVRAFPNVICFGYVDVQIVVDAPPPPPPPTTSAPPATPVNAPARFAG